MNAKLTFPYINPDVRYQGVSSLRQMTQRNLEKLEHPIVIKREGDGQELVVVVPWQTYLGLQGELFRNDAARNEGGRK
jgi:hypothetical protein